jgi:hypothetical protein
MRFKKKRELLFIILFFAQITWAWAQAESYSRLSFTAERMQYSDRLVHAGGLVFEYYISDWFSISYPLDFGVNSQNRFYMRFPTGVWLATYPFTTYANTGQNFWLYASIVAVVLPESLHWHIRASENFHISPFAAPLGMYYEKTINDNSPALEAGFTGGLRFDVFRNNLAFSPYLAGRSLYRRGSGWGLVGGFTFGWTFE